MKNAKIIFIAFMFITCFFSCTSPTIEEEVYIEIVEEEIANDEDNVDIDNDKDD